MSRRNPTTAGNDYYENLRAMVGNFDLMIVAARAVILDEQGRVLFIRRRDNGRWALPAGKLELNETIYECLVREVGEETGLEVLAATAMAVYSGSKYGIVSARGNPYQFVFVTFWVDEWQGELLRETNETTAARFFPLDDLPETHPHHLEVLDDFQRFDGNLILR